MDPAAPLDITSIAARLDTLLQAAPAHPQPAAPQAVADPQVSGPRRPRVPENDARIMRFEEFRRDSPPYTQLTPEQRRRYGTLCTAASKAREHLRRHPELVGWYAQRETLAAMGAPLSSAGPMPTTPEGRRLARKLAYDEQVRQQQEHEWMMTCDLPRPHLVRVGERSADALAERREASKLLREILDYRKRQEWLDRRTTSWDPASSLADATGEVRRQRRMAMKWRERCAEDLFYLSDHGLHVSCDRPTQKAPLLLRTPRKESA